MMMEMEKSDNDCTNADDREIDINAGMAGV